MRIELHYEKSGHDMDYTYICYYFIQLHDANLML